MRQGEIRIKTLTFVSKGLPIAGVNATNDRIEARQDQNADGLDIFWNPSERHYRISRYNGQSLALEIEMHESRVEFRTRWPM